ncbi:GerAB/ArcD/ProY family transporter [Paenibacillus sp. LMG 31461]|uniref:GerAB/ArcD/ProY family transporter n=1 Tax=Paenibacillus plantarum TaxID=2654975 RepID=A0ABX1X2H5_9BACL|nr:endospore germination permease [Paenibacillus plantarum]NOU62514.1 GerAB/ArcD/ProY family transporter [Paenibacillus plantarum]
MKKMNLTGIQIFWIVFSFQSGNTLLLTISPTIKEAQQDAWIGGIIAGVLGLFIAYVSTKLSLLFPGQTIVQYSQVILGKWVGKLIMIPYFIQWYSVLGVILKEFSDFTIATLLPRTPVWILTITMVLLLIYITYIGGIEGIGRCGELLGPFIVIMLILILPLNIPVMDWTRILPIYEDTGIGHIFKGALSPLSFFGEVCMLTMLVSFMKQPLEAPVRAMLGLGAACFLFIVSTLFVIMVFGPGLSAKMTHPFFDMVRFISFGGFIENIDVVIVLIWIISVFIKMSIYFFISCYGTAQWLHMKDWRKLIWFVAPIVLIQSWMYPNITVSDIEYVTRYWIPIVLPINMFGIPLFLWIVASIRKKVANAY